MLLYTGPVHQPTNPFLSTNTRPQQPSSFGYAPEEYNGISMNPTQGAGGEGNFSSGSGSGSGYAHYNSQY